MADRKEDYVASSFDQAFARARRSGSKTFKWANPKTGKMGEYSTKMAGEDVSTPKSADSSTSTRSAMYSSPADTAKFRADRDKPRTGGGSPRTPSRGITAFKNAYKVAQEEQTRAGKGVKEAEETTKRTTREMLADVPGMAAEAALAAATPAAGRAILPRMGGLNPKAIEQALSRVPGRAVPNVTAKDLMRGQSTPEIGQGLVDRLTEAARYSPETAAGLKKGGAVKSGKVKTVMHEFKTGKLHSGSGQKVTNPKQAIAIAMSEAGMSKKAKKFAGKDGSYVGGMSDKEAKAYADTELANQETARKMMKERAEELRQRKSEVERKAGKTMQSIRQSQEDSSFTTMPYKKGGKVGESKEMAKKEISFMQRKGAPKSMIKHEKEEYGMKRGGKVKKFAAGGSIRGYADGGMPTASGMTQQAAMQAMGGRAPNALRQVGGPAQAAQSMQGLPRVQSGQRVFPQRNTPEFNTIARNYAVQNTFGNSPAGRQMFQNIQKTASPLAARENDIYSNFKTSLPYPTDRASGQVYSQALMDYMSGYDRELAPLRNGLMSTNLAYQRAMDNWANDPANEAAIRAEMLNYIRSTRSPQGYKKGGAIAMKKGGACMKKGGSIDGIAQRGKTKTQHFAKGGAVSSRADGIATKGKTKCKMR